MSKTHPSFREVFTDDDWIIEDIELWTLSDEYHFKATHNDGRVLELSEDRKKVDLIIKEIQDGQDQ